MWRRAGVTAAALCLIMTLGLAQTYPLRINAGGRYLEDQSGTPFLINGDAGWSLVAQPTYAQAIQYLTDRKSRGFNAVIVNLIEHKFADHAPANCNNDSPFTGTTFTTPNERYFSHVDSVLTRANQLGMVVFLFPIYLGYSGTTEGWSSEVAAASAADLGMWGQYVGNRYKNYANIVWVMGGDINPQQLPGAQTKIDNMVASLKASDTIYPNRLITTHSEPGSQAVTHWPESWMTLNNIYTSTSAVISTADAAYDRSPALPFFLIESTYENEKDETGATMTTQKLRAQAYWTMLRGGAGSFFGNCPLWSFASNTASFCGQTDWQTAMSGPGSVSMTNYRNLFASRHWQQLIPDRTARALVSGASSGTSTAVAAYTSDSTSLILYTPTQRALSINPSVLSGDSVRVAWYNPSTGVYASTATYSKVTRSYTPPSSGDWVMVMDTVVSNAVVVVVPTGSLQASASSLPAGGGTVTLTWTSTNAASASIAPTIGAVALNGSTSVTVSSTTTFVLTLTSATGGTASFSTVVSVALPTPPGTPVLLAPANGAVNQPVSLSLTWNAVSDAAAYRVQLAADSLFGSPLVDDSNVTAVTYAVGPLNNLSQYYWRVSARNGSGTSAFSAIRRFTTAPYVKTQRFFTFTAGTGANATVSLPSTIVASIGGAALQSGDEVGAFTPAGLCVGAAEWNGADATITVWGDDQQTPAADGIKPGDMIQYRLYRQAINTVYAYTYAQYSVGTGMYLPGAQFRLASLRSLASAPAQTTHTLALAQGWNWISPYAIAPTPVVETMTAQLAPTMTIMKNGWGNVYWPAFGINTIGYWDFTQGYMLYMSAPGLFGISGAAIVPEGQPIALSAGWNLVPYYRRSVMDVPSAVQTLGSSLIYMQNADGQAYWPSQGINTIGSMVPGQAYQMYLSQAFAFFYPPNALGKSGNESMARAQTETVHYPPLAHRGGDHEVLLVKSAGFVDGDEVAVRTSTRKIAGTGIVNNGKALVCVWADDRFTPEAREGADEGEALSIERWSKADGKERGVNVTGVTDGLTGAALSNALTFTTNAVLIAQTVVPAAAVPTEYTLMQNYPNPFNPSTVIAYTLPSPGMVTLEVYSLLGERVSVLVNEEQAAGTHSVSFNAAGLSSGVYFYLLRSGPFITQRRMLLLK